MYVFSGSGSFLKSDKISLIVIVSFRNGLLIASTGPHSLVLFLFLLIFSIFFDPSLVTFIRETPSGSPLLEMFHLFTLNWKGLDILVRGAAALYRICESMCTHTWPIKLSEIKLNKKPALENQGCGVWNEWAFSIWAGSNELLAWLFNSGIVRSSVFENN